MSHYEELARELETIHDRKDELAPLITHVRDDNYPKEALVQELLDARLGFFAYKLNADYYDKSAEEYQKHLLQLDADKQTAQLAKEAVENAALSQEEAATVETEKKEEAEVSTQPETTETSTPTETPESTPETPVIPQDAPTETPAPVTEIQTPVEEEKPLPHCPSCAGFHVSFTQEHPEQLPDQSA